MLRSQKSYGEIRKRSSFLKWFFGEVQVIHYRAFSAFAYRRESLSKAFVKHSYLIERLHNLACLPSPVEFIEKRSRAGVLLFITTIKKIPPRLRTLIIIIAIVEKISLRWLLGWVRNSLGKKNVQLLDIVCDETTRYTITLVIASAHNEAHANNIHFDAIFYFR